MVFFIHAIDARDFKETMQTEFDMTNLGVMKYFLGIGIHQFANGIFVFQQKYASYIIQKFRMTNCNPVETPIAQGTKLSKEDVAPPLDPPSYNVQLVVYLSYCN